MACCLRYQGTTRSYRRQRGPKSNRRLGKKKEYICISTGPVLMLSRMLTLVERRGVGSVHPRVRKDYRCGPVFDNRGEVSAAEERFVESQLEHEVKSRIDVDTPSKRLDFSIDLENPAEGQRKRLTGSSRSIRARKYGTLPRNRSGAVSTNRRFCKRHSGTTKAPS